MRNRPEPHTFHVPVMGIGFTIDSPIKLAFLGISSSISMVDDMLMEKMRKFYCENLDIPYHAITNRIHDFRAERITAWLNLVDSIVKEKFEKLLSALDEKSCELERYLDMLPTISELREKAVKVLQDSKSIKEIKTWLHENLVAGNIDVNIMTKLDKANFIGNEELPLEFNDAHAALRGFARSNLESSVILSAGLNPRLYSYMEQFEDFFPDSEGRMKKKIILKISDYRSALIQGKFLAKKGLWISEFRIESGLNCGGHSFGTDGALIGPILEEFRNNKAELVKDIFELYVTALKEKNRAFPEVMPDVKFTAQGGVGTAEEHQFLLDYYELDSIGWGTPFLLVPEATNVDPHTLALLSEAKEKDLYLSDISPLGVPFNSLKGNTKDQEKEALVKKGQPGSPCLKKYASLSKEFTKKAICTASRQYQTEKIIELKSKNLDSASFDKEFNKIVNKSCLCVGLGTSALITNDIDTKEEGKGVSVCPGPNMAYFSEIVSLMEMVNHIYGRTNIIKRNDRPNMFIKELEINLNYFRKIIKNMSYPFTVSNTKYIQNFTENLLKGINYYKDLFRNTKQHFSTEREELITELESIENKLREIFARYFVSEPVSQI